MEIVRSGPQPELLAPELGEAWIGPNRKRLAVYGVLGLIMAAASADMAIFSNRQAVGWLGLIFFGAAALVSFWRATARREKGVQLTRQGFAIVSASRRKLYRWDEVQNFQVVTLRYTSFVGFDLSDPTRGGALAHMGRALSGVDDMLPGPLAMKPEVVVGVLRAWQRYYANRAAS